LEVNGENDTPKKKNSDEIGWKKTKGAEMT